MPDNTLSALIYLILCQPVRHYHAFQYTVDAKKAKFKKKLEAFILWAYNFPLAQRAEVTVQVQVMVSIPCRQSGCSI